MAIAWQEPDQSMDASPEDRRRSMADMGDDSGFVSGCRSGDHVTQFNSEDDLVQLAANQRELEACGFYWEDLTQADAMEMLQPRPQGTYLVRPSAHPSFLYSVSMRTARGATSVRVSYNHGMFGFDGEESWSKPRAQFTSVLALIEFYTRSREECDTATTALVMHGKHDRKSVRIVFTEPLKKRGVADLKHLSRRRINDELRKGVYNKEDCIESSLRLNIEKLPHLSPKEKTYLKEYPYKV